MANDELRIESRTSSTWTVEWAIYAVIGLLAAGLRLLQLGLRPLNEGEALQALAAFRFTQGTAQAAPASTIPALFTGNVFGFSLLGTSDITARLLPAFAGVLLALLPYGLRHRLGRSGAVATSLLLAISPSMVYFSRAVDGAIIVAACGLAVAVGLINYVDTRRSGALYLTAAALGLGLVAGPGFYTLLLIFASFALLLYVTDRWLNREAGWSSLLVAWWAIRGEKDTLAKAGAALAAVFGLVATALVLHPAGIGHAADLLGAWAKGFLPEPGGNPAIYLALLPLRYEPVILLLGLVELAHAIAGNRAERHRAAQPGSSFPHTAFLAFWTGMATLIILLSGHRPAGNLLLALVPMALLAGQRVERIWHRLARKTSYSERETMSLTPRSEAGVIAALAVALSVCVYLLLAAYSWTNNVSTTTFVGITLLSSTSYLLLVALVLLLLTGLAIGAGFWRGIGLVRDSGWLAVLVILGLFGFKAMWGLNFARASDPRELMIAQTTAPDVHLLVERLEALSLAQVGDTHTLPITVDATTGPVVAWYLREFHQQTVVDDLSTPPDTAAAVTLARQDLPIGEAFRGQGFPLRHHWQPWGLWGQSLLRWLLFTDRGLPIIDQEIVLWVPG
jgi:uncharacterized protein (TIGR03663 family)